MISQFPAAPQEPDNEIELGVLWRGVRRRLRLILMATLVMALAVYTLSRFQTPVYEASASVLASNAQSQIGVVGGSVVSALPLGTADQVLHSPLIVRPLIQAVQANVALNAAERQQIVRTLNRELTNTTTTQGKRVVEIGADQGTGENSIYTLRARASSAAAAQFLANTSSNLLLTWESGRVLRDVRLAQSNFTLQLSQVERRLGLPGLSPEERQSQIFRRATLQDNLAQLGFLIESKPGSLQPLTSAIEPLRPLSPSPLRNGVLAGLLVGLLGLGLAALLTITDRTVRSEDELLALGLPILGLIPRLKQRDLSQSGLLQASRQAGLSEAVGFLSVNLLSRLNHLDERVHPPCIMVSSTAPGEGKSSLTAMLADGLAASGQRVLIVDANLRRGIQQELWSRSGQPVWRQLVGAGGGQHLQDALRDPQNVQVIEAEPNVDVLPAGPGLQSSLTLLSRPDLGKLLKCWGRNYHIVLVDSPPLLALADGLVVGRQMDGVILVIDAGQTKLQAVRQVLRRTREADMPIMGFVVNKLPESERESYGQQYSYASRPTGDA
ncbi:Wzz/FepE/Etk N-terminal domain-containing protein [Deinococcus sp.]|uniref:polysaccharide biosynthesis tyrosine autokinase n=1 Tax=Deinococcus sp. TaxID=47478 RepID=UPI003B59FAC5